MTQIVGLVRFIRRTREAYDPAEQNLLHPEDQGLHYFYKAMLMMYETKPKPWSPEDVALALCGATLQEDENFAMALVDGLITNNREASVQEFLSKAYWLYRNNEIESLNEKLLTFYKSAGDDQ